jgi:MraW methylase family protein
LAEARKQWGRQRLHPATKTFLALRIAVNREMEELGQFLSRTFCRFGAVLLGIVFVLSGCGVRGARAAGGPTASMIVGRDCIVSVMLTDKTECAGADLEHLRCTGLTLTYKAGCEKLRIAR